MAYWWWPCVRLPGPGVFVGALHLDGEGGTVNVGPSISGGGGEVRATTDITLAHATGDFSIASVFYGVGISTSAAQPPSANQGNPTPAAAAPSPRVVSSQQGCTYTFRSSDTVSEGGSRHGRRQRKRRPAGSG